MFTAVRRSIPYDIHMAAVTTILNRREVQSEGGEVVHPAILDR